MMRVHGTRSARRAAPCSARDSRTLPSSSVGAFDDEVVGVASQRP